MGVEGSKLKSKELQTLRLNTDFTDEEIREWHNWYRCVVTDIPSGRIDIKEFKKIYNMKMYHVCDFRMI